MQWGLLSSCWKSNDIQWMTSPIKSNYYREHVLIHYFENFLKTLLKWGFLPRIKTFPLLNFYSYYLQLKIDSGIPQTDQFILFISAIERGTIYFPLCDNDNDNQKSFPKSLNKSVTSLTIMIVRPSIDSSFLFQFLFYSYLCAWNVLESMLLLCGSLAP